MSADETQRAVLQMLSALGLEGTMKMKEARRSEHRAVTVVLFAASAKSLP
jgi:hypothetical protein